MKRLAALLSVVVIIFAALFLLWPHPQPGSNGGGNQTMQDKANLNPRPLTDVEQAAFLPLVCGGASGAGGGFAHQCTSLPGYPDQDYGGAGLGLGITLQTVTYGHLTSADADEAYVTYTGSFEPHVTNFGGGILFTGGPGAWKLKSWHPGGQADDCVSLNPGGRAKFVCLYGFTGQGEQDSLLALVSLPPPSGDLPSVLRASDLRNTGNPNGNCNASAGKGVLLSIDHLAPAADGAVADITYVSADTAKAACAKQDFANAPVTKAKLALRWNGSKLAISPDLNLATAE